MKIVDMFKRNGQIHAVFQRLPRAIGILVVIVVVPIAFVGSQYMIFISLGPWIENAHVDSVVPAALSLTAATLGGMLISIALGRALYRWICLDERVFKGIPCGHCGYDLHGNTSGRCPECGESSLKDSVQQPGKERGNGTNANCENSS